MIYAIDLESYCNAISLIKDSPSIGIDIETYILPQWRNKVSKAIDPHTSGISLVGITTPEGDIAIIDVILLERADVTLNELIEIFQTRKEIVAFNASFEARFLKKHWGLNLRTWWDARIAQQLIGNATGSKFFRGSSAYNLKSCVRDWFSVVLKKEYGAQDWLMRPEDLSDPWWLESLKYLEEDLKYLYPLKQAQESVIRTPMNNALSGTWGLNMGATLDLENQFITCNSEMMFNGVPFSKDLNKLFQEGIYNPYSKTGVLLELGGELCQMLGLSVEKNPRVPYLIPTEKSLRALNSHAQLKKLLTQKTGILLDSTQTEVLTRLMDLLQQQSEGSVEFVDEEEEQVYQQIRELENTAAYEYCLIAKMVVTYKRLAKQQGMNLGKYVNPSTGRIHPSIDQVGAGTGRNTCADPNLQQTAARTHLKVKLHKEDYLKLLGYKGWKYGDNHSTGTTP